MAINPNNGVLDIINGTLKVSSIDIKQAGGFTTAINTVARNDVLLYDDQHTNTTFTPTQNAGYSSSSGVTRDTTAIDFNDGWVYWPLQLPNSWHTEFDILIPTTGGVLTYSLFNTSEPNHTDYTANDGGYKIVFDNTQNQIDIRWEGSVHATTSANVRSADWQHVNINYFQGAVSISLAGKVVLTHKFTENYQEFDSRYVGFSATSGASHKIRHLIVHNSDKWLYTKTSHASDISYVSGNVGIGSLSPTELLDVHGNVHIAKDLTVDGNLTVSGTTTFIDTQNLAIEDPIIEVARGNASDTIDAGLVITRASSNVAVAYRGDEEELALGYTQSGASDTDVTPVADGGLSVRVYGNLFANNLTTTANVEATYLKGNGSEITHVTLDQVVDYGNTTANTIHLTNADVGLKADGNVEANYFIGNGSQLDGISSTLQEITDNGNVTTNTIQFTNTTTALVADSNVGIGTDAPSANLHVVGHQYVNDPPTVANSFDHSDAPLTLTHGTPTSTTAIDDPKPVLHLTRDGTSGQAYGARASFNLSRYENSGTASRSRLDVALTDGTYAESNVMSIRADGKVGIGTTAPGYTLDVHGTANVGALTATSISGPLSGNASTATALQTARTIGGVSFDGTANINLPGVNTGGNQNTSGNAATATALQTARTIGGVSFDGTANIDLPGVNTAGTQNTSGNAATATTATNQSGGTVSCTSGNFSGTFAASSASSRDKFRVYPSSQYCIGMQSGVTYGDLNDWSMTFQMNNEDDRGFWWGDDGHGVNQGAMALSTRGWLNVAERIKVGGGQTDTGAASYPLHVVGTSYFTNTLNIQPSSSGGGQNLFTGYTTGDSYGRAQLVLSSGYSDVIIASSQANDNHGSNLSFVTYNPSNAADYRKFVINQGNWGTRKQFLDFGYADAAYANPHGYINSTDTVLTLDGINKRVGIKNINPGHNLSVIGNAYISSTLECDDRIYADNGCHVRGDWLRVNGSNGIYFQSYGGGWHMTDSTWVRAYNSKPVWVTDHVHVHQADTGVATLSAYGDSQGTGRLYVGQSSTYGGGIEYNGDNSPASTGAGADYITLYRVENGTYNWTARNLYNSNDWNFRGQVYAAGAFYTDANRSVIRGGSPTLYFRDTDQMSAMIHNNANQLYILRGGTDTETWTQVNGQWPWVFNLVNNDSTCGGNLYVNGGTVTATTFSGNATTASSAATLSGVTINKIFNNMGGNHNSRTDFNAIPDAGAYYVMGSTNGPGVNSASQYYGFTLGLGSDYSPVVNQSGKYGTQIYWGRNVSNPYINIRYLENGSWGSWQKASAGYADSAGTATNQSGGTVSASTGSFSSAIYYNEWIRNNGTSASGLYWHNSSNPGYAWHIYPENRADMTFRTGAGNGGIKGTVENATARGYIHWTTGNEIGFLNSSRQWSLRMDNSKNCQIYGNLTVDSVLRSRYTAGRLSGTFDTSGLNIGDFAESTSAMPQIGWEIHLSFSVSTEGANVRIYGAYIPSQVLVGAAEKATILFAEGTSSGWSNQSNGNMYLVSSAYNNNPYYAIIRVHNPIYTNANAGLARHHITSECVGVYTGVGASIWKSVGYVDLGGQNSSDRFNRLRIVTSSGNIRGQWTAFPITT